jgi:ribonucleotide reductase beta subunit family protein with ferritin-like domain
VDEGPESPGYGPNPLCDAADVESEPLLMENPSRFVIFPITEQSIWSMYKNVEATFWNTEEIDVSKDGAHFAALAPPERAFFEALLPSLCEVNDAVQANLLHRFTQEIQATEARFFFGNEISMLGMHGEMYCTLLEQLCPQPAQLLAKQVQAQAMPCLQAKLGWCEQWKNSSAPLGHRFVGFAAVQSIMCAGAAAAVGWMGERKMMPGLVSAAAHIQKDLGKYVEFLSLLHGMLKKQTPDADIERIVKDAVKIEKEFMLASGLDCTAIGLDAAQMSAYIEWTADTLLQALGKRKVYGVTNPYDWASASSPRAAGATQAALAKTTSTMVREDPADSVLTFGLDDDDF